MNTIHRYFLFLTLFVLSTIPGLAQATAIDFAGLFGGTLSYAGDVNGPAPLVGTNFPINLVFTPGGPLAVVTGGDLDFTTGNYSGATDLPGSSFISFFDPGGLLTITGGILGGPSMSGPLLTATFSGPSIFNYVNFGFASFTGGLSVTSVNSGLASVLGITPFDSGSGTIAQADFFVDFNGSAWGFGTPAPGQAFSGTQASVNIAVGAPEPGTLLLLGSGLAGLGLLRRKKLSQANA
jgi:hypothetical protein